MGYVRWRRGHLVHFERCCWDVKRVEGIDNEDEGIEMGG